MSEIYVVWWQQWWERVNIVYESIEQWWLWWEMFLKWWRFYEPSSLLLSRSFTSHICTVLPGGPLVWTRRSEGRCMTDLCLLLRSCLTKSRNTHWISCCSHGPCSSAGTKSLSRRWDFPRVISTFAGLPIRESPAVNLEKSCATPTQNLDTFRQRQVQERPVTLVLGYTRWLVMRQHVSNLQLKRGMKSQEVEAHLLKWLVFSRWPIKFILNYLCVSAHVCVQAQVHMVDRQVRGELQTGSNEPAYQLKQVQHLLVTWNIQICKLCHLMHCLVWG